MKHLPLVALLLAPPAALAADAPPTPTALQVAQAQSALMSQLVQEIINTKAYLEACRSPQPAPAAERPHEDTAPPKENGK